MASHTRRSWMFGVAALSACTLLAVTLHAAMASPGKSAAAPQDTAANASGKLIIYCGRSESLVGELIERFRAETGIQVQVKYGKTGPLASLILEEGRRSPADVFFAQDPGGLGLLAQAERLVQLPHDTLEQVAYEHRDPMNRWVGVTGRVRTIAYSPARVKSADLPQTMMNLTDARWKGRIGWAPSNASFQAFVTAMRHQLGEDVTEKWLRDMLANGVRTFPNNMPIVQAICDGEIDLGLVNHYYVERFRAERGDKLVANHVPKGDAGEGDICGALLVSGVAILESAPNRAAAERFVSFLLSEKAQTYFAHETFEYPLSLAVAARENVPALGTLPARSIDLNQLGDLEETLVLLRKVGALR